MVAIRQKKIDEEEKREENRQLKEKEKEEEKEKQNKLRKEEIRTMKGWTEKESQEHVEKYKWYRGDTRCRRCRWFGHIAHYCRREEIKAKREMREGWFENKWELLKCRVMACEEERIEVHFARREVQQLVKCWGCGEEEHYLWTCPRKAVHPEQGKAQQRKLVCRECKKKNHVARSCNSY